MQNVADLFFKRYSVIQIPRELVLAFSESTEPIVIAKPN